MSTAATVVALRATGFRIPLARPWGPAVRSLGLIVTEVETADGATGVGFSWTPTIGAHSILALLRHDCRDHLIGMPAVPELVFDDLRAHLHESGRGGLTTMAMAGVDIALWDLRARRAGEALADHLGRRHDSVAVYGSGINLHYPLDELTAQAKRWVDAGYGAVKIKVGRPDLAEDEERVAAVRDVIGPHRDLMIDANQRWDLPTATRAIERLAVHDLCWVEEPLPADNLDAYRELRTRVRVPIAAGENRYTPQEFVRLASAGVDVLQPNIVRVGGITPFRRIVDRAADSSTPVHPHLLMDLSGLLALTMVNAPAVEHVEDASFGELGVLSGEPGVLVDTGRLRPGDGTGHGIRFDTSGLGALDG